MAQTKIKYVDGKKFIAENRTHRTIIDLPKESGGIDQGLTPQEAFISSLGSCVGVYVIGYCDKVGLNTQGLNIVVDWEKEAQAKPYYINKISIRIELPNADVGPRKPALLKIAESCLIHETIKNDPDISIELV
ncbi:MAG: OsmC family protein [Candidatus Omnitrophota bacterium]